MKLSEFEEKLTTVSDGKLRRMLADCRKNGPEVAVKLILAEAARRGVSLEDEAEPPLPDYLRGAPSAAAPAAGPGPSPSGTSLPEASLSEAAPADSADPGLPADSGAPVTKGAWLAEEQDSGMPVFVKVLLTLLVLAGVGAGLMYLLNKGG